MQIYTLSLLKCITTAGAGAAPGASGARGGRRRAGGAGGWPAAKPPRAGLAAAAPPLLLEATARRPPAATPRSGRSRGPPPPLPAMEGAEEELALEAPPLAAGQRKRCRGSDGPRVATARRRRRCRGGVMRPGPELQGRRPRAPTSDARLMEGREGAGGGYRRGKGHRRRQLDLHPLCWRRDFLISRCKHCRRGKTSFASPILHCVVEVSLTA